MLQQSNIFLIGPMGAGKTTVGRRLAQLRGLSFVDSDHEIEQRTGVDIPYIFEREGEPGFRRREHQAIEGLTARSGIENRRLLAARGVVVYLQAGIDQQLARTLRSGNRPLLQQAADRRAVLEELMRIRDPLYREIADLVVATDRRSARAVVQDIETFLDGMA
jgi:shikimate kinase